MGCKKANIFCFLLFGFFSISILAQEEKIEYKSSPLKPTTYLLNITTKENHYNDIIREPFEGYVVIKLIKESETNVTKDITVDLNADSNMTNVNAKLIVKSKQVLLADNSNKEIPGKHVENKISFPLKKDEYNRAANFEIQISYKAHFGEDMTGFYRSFYEESKKKRWLLTTHFEPIFARKAFPCFDTPDLKAIFEVTIKIPQTMDTYHVLSNTPCKKNVESNYIVYTCEKATVPMSTYLVAFTVSDFKHTSELKFNSAYPNTANSPTREVSLKTYGQKSLVEKQGELSQNASREAITKLTEYLSLGYALKKLDQLGIPDFTAGAMENWGLISYRENKLFFDNTNGSKITKQGNVLTITHELVHQWFGNLVTPETWDNIWLNEAFATYLQYLIGDQLKNPDTSKWEYLKQQVINEIHLRAFEADGISSSKELSHPIKDENLIFSYFNDISYSKGSAVLRMWDLSLPKDTFKKSLNKYLNERKGNSANPNQLYEAFKNQAKMNANFFYSWVNQPGYPVVEVKKVNDSYSLTQSRFLWEKQNSTNNSTWVLPLTYTTDKSIADWKTETDIFFDKTSHTIKANGSWIILNNQQAGYYRVNYEKQNWLALSQALKHENFSKIHVLNRAQILNDVFSLARSLQKKYVEYSTALNLAEYLENEKSFFPWKTALNAFGFLQTKLYKDKKIYPQFTNYVLRLIKSHFKDLECQNLEHIDTLKTVEISRWACSLNYESCITNAVNLFKKGSLPPDTQEIILCTAVRKIKEAPNKVLELYKNTSDSSLKIMYLSALGCTDDQMFLSMYLNKTIADTSDIRKQDFFYVLSSVYNGNLNNVKTAFEFVKTNYKIISSKYGGINPLGKALVGIAKKLDSEEELQKMKTLGETISKNITSVKESVETALSIIQSNIEWTKEKKPEIFTYFFSAGSLASYSFALLSACLVFIFVF